MRRGFTLLEVLAAVIILGLGATVLLASMSQANALLHSSTEFQTALEVMDLGEMAYPLADVKDVDDLDVRETKATELWRQISDDERLTREQEEKYHGYTWERECLNKHDKQDDIDRIGGLYTVRVTVRWGDRHMGHGYSDSYVALWRKPE